MLTILSLAPLFCKRSTVKAKHTVSELLLTKDLFDYFGFNKISNQTEKEKKITML